MQVARKKCACSQDLIGEGVKCLNKSKGMAFFVQIRSIKEGRMKLSIIVAIVSAFIFFNAGPVTADEISDLTKKIEVLQQTIDELKEQLKEVKQKQEDQQEAVEALEDQPPASKVVSEALQKTVNIGGHLKFYLADRTDGEVNGNDQKNNLSAGVSDLWLYFSKQLTDWLSIDVAPRVEVIAAATPSLGGDITRASSADVDLDLWEAYMTLRLPYRVELRAGALLPYFSEEYATQSWWHEQYHGNNGLVRLQAWRDNGIELYRAFDFENWSLPIYLYPYLNGSSTGDDDDATLVDNNGAKSALLHIAPETFLGGARLRFLGSVGYGRWDANDDNDGWQYALGGEVSYKGFNLKGEYLFRGLMDAPLLGGGTADFENKGYYVRGMYTFNPKWRALVKWSDVDQPFISTTMLTDNYQDLSFAVNYWITQGSTIIGQVDFVDAERSDNSEKLEYLRWTIGWRTTF